MKTIFILLFTLIATILSASEREVSVKHEWGKLHGSLTVPEGGSETVALIIAGSGPTDRNGNSRPVLVTNCYALIAKELEKSGIASLRYDKRGVAASKPISLININDVTFEDFIDDAELWVDFLKKEGFKKVVIIGHSEGGLLALCVGQDSSKVSGVVSLAGAGYPINEVLETQLSAQLMMTHYALLAKAKTVINTLKQGKTTDKYPMELASLFSPSVQPFLISWMQHDPQELARTLPIPLLIVNGDNDIQVSVDNAEALAKAQPKARKVIVTDMTHVLKNSKIKDRVQQATTVYNNGQLPLSDGLIKPIVEFIESL